MTSEVAASRSADGRRYIAFLSYSHTGAGAENSDAEQAKHLQRALEHYKVPSPLVGARTAAGLVSKRLGNVFRDDDYLPAGPELGDLIEGALRNSDNLIVICSPRAVASQWVGREITRFKQLRSIEMRDHGSSSRRIFALLAEGSPEESFPPPLTMSVDTEGRLTAPYVEPFAPSLAKDGREGALLRIIAGILGVDFEDLVAREDARRRAERRRAMFLFATGLVLTILAVFGIASAGVLGWRNAAARSDLLAAFADQSLAERRPDEATLFALAAAPPPSGDILPFRARAHRALTSATLHAENASSIVRAHSIDVSSAQLAADGRSVLTAAIDGNLRRTDLRSGRTAWQANVGKAVWRAVASANGRTIVAATFGGTTRIWRDGVQQQRVLAANAEPVALELSRSDARLLVATRDSVAIHRLPDLDAERVFAASSVSAAAFAPDESVIAIAHNDGSVDLAERTTGRTLWHLGVHAASVNRLRFSPDGTRLVTASVDRSAVLIDVRRGATIARMPSSGPVLAVEFSGDGRRIATSSTDGSVQVWDGATGSERLYFPTNGGWTAALAISRDGALVAAGTRGGALFLVDANHGRLTLTLIGHRSEVSFAAFSPDAKSLVSVSVDGTLRTWSTAPRRVVCDAGFPGADIQKIVVSPDGTRAGVLLGNGNVRVVSVANCASRRDFGDARLVDVIATNGGFVSRAENGRIERWDAAGFRRGAPVEGIRREAAWAVSHDGMVVASVRGAGLQTWSVRDGLQPLAYFDFGPAPPRALAVGGGWVAAALGDSSIVAARIDESAEVRRASVPAAAVAPLRLSQTGRVMAAPLADGAAMLWAIGSNNPVRRIGISGRRIVEAIPDDRRRIVTAITDPPAVYQLSMSTLEILAEYPLTRLAGAVAVTPDGELFLSGARDRMVVQHMLPRDLALVRYACSVLPPGMQSLSEESLARAEGVLRANDMLPCERSSSFGFLRPLGRLFEGASGGF